MGVLKCIVCCMTALTSCDLRILMLYVVYSSGLTVAIRPGDLRCLPQDCDFRVCWLTSGQAVRRQTAKLYGHKYVLCVPGFDYRSQDHDDSD